MMRITSKGQVTIPQEIREQAGLMPGTDVEFEIDGRGAVRVVKAKARQGRKTRGQKLVERLSGKGDFGGMNTDEIIALMRGPGPDDRPRRRRSPPKAIQSK